MLKKDVFAEARSSQYLNVLWQDVDDFIGKLHWFKNNVMFV